MVAVAPMPHVESVSVGFWLGVGGRHESRRQNGIFHFLEHMMFKGTTRRTAREISEEVEGVGGYLNAFTAEEMTCYYARASATHLRSVVEVLTDMLLGATFPAAEIVRERGVIQEEIRMYEDQPCPGRPGGGDRAALPHERSGPSARGYKSGRLPHSPPRSAELSPQVLPFRQPLRHGGGQDRYGRGAGSAQAAFAQIPKGQPLSLYTGHGPAGPHRVSNLSASRLSRAISSLAMRGVSLHDPRRSAFRLMSVILGENMSSRLFPSGARGARAGLLNQHRRELLPGGTGTFFINAGVENSKVEQAIRLTLQTVRKLARRAPSAKELRRAKEYTLRPDSLKPGKAPTTR